MKAKAIRLPEDLLKIARFLSDREDSDESDILRKLIKKGAQKYLIELYQKGEISLRQVAHVLTVSIYDAIDLLLKEGVKGNVTTDQVFESFELLKRQQK